MTQAEQNNNELLENLGGRGEGLVKENVQESEILVKLKGSFGEGLILTNQKIYILKWGLMAGNLIGGRCAAFGLANITGLEIKKNLLTGTFEVLTPATQNAQKSYWGKGANDAIRSDNVITFQRNNFKRFSEAVQIGRDLINKYHSKNEETTRSNYLTELERLATLKEKKVISEEEFQTKKKQILGI